MRKIEFKHSIVLAALRVARGNVREASKILEVSRTTMYAWLNTYPGLADELDKIRKERQKKHG